MLAPSTHTTAPVPQATTPRLQMLGLEVHEAPAVQPIHEPEGLHTAFVPHDVPAERSVPFTQAAVPLVQAVVPKKQGLGLLLHEAPAVQDEHTPVVEQTWFVPQLWPAAFCEPSSHEGPLNPQLVTPFQHGLGLPVHDVPAMQLTHEPEPVHVRPAPQAVPADLGLPSTQLAAPVLHEMAPSRQGSGLVVQVAPAAQDTQLPPDEQTLPEPHAEPAALSEPFSQIGAPEPHESVPNLHGSLFVEHDIPETQGEQRPLPSQT